jgi:hypothetical protein
MTDQASGPVEVLSNDGLGAARLTRWVMHDNHTFTRLPFDSDAAYALAMKCFDDDRGWIMLCGTWSDERENQARRRPESLMAHAVETRATFAELAMRWLHANPGACNEKREDGDGQIHGVRRGEHWPAR